MSSLIVEVTEILDVVKHPNADNLDLIKIKGWQCVSQKDIHQKGDKVIYVPIDTMFPQELSDQLSITNYLSKGRLRTIKLRGEYSQGMVISMNHLPKQYQNSEIGFDVAEILGLTKYEPPASFQGNPRGFDPRFPNYTDIENIKNFPDVLEEGEDVVITEKIHGTNFRVGNIDGELFFGSRRMNLKPPNDGDVNLYWNFANQYDFMNLLKPGQIIYGEIYGTGVQKGLDYDGKQEKKVRFFDLMEDLKYVDYDVFKCFCDERDLPIVPLLRECKWNNDLLDLASGTTLLGKHIREGFVVKPKKERNFGRGFSRVIFKHINEKYLLKDYGDTQ